MEYGHGAPSDGMKHGAVAHSLCCACINNGIRSSGTESDGRIIHGPETRWARLCCSFLLYVCSISPTPPNSLAGQLLNSQYSCVCLSNSVYSAATQYVHIPQRKEGVLWTVLKLHSCPWVLPNSIQSNLSCIACRPLNLMVDQLLLCDFCFFFGFLFKGA
jgi:hypothetical protein